MSPTSFCSDTKSFMSAGTTLRTPCGITTIRSVCAWFSPSERAATRCEGCTASIPARSTSAMYAE